MRRCFIHIGHPKTATTYLQQCMHLNAALFARHNYWVPSDFSELGFQNLELLSQRGEIFSGNLAPMHVLLTEGMEALAPQMEEYLFRPPAATPECDVVLSSEMFFYYWACTLKVVDGARRFGLEPCIVVYVARQDTAAIAAYLQNVRYHGFSGGVIDFLAQDASVPYCHYTKILQWMIARAPDLQIICRSFEARFLRSDDILTDFLHVIGGRVAAGDCVRPYGRSNPGLLVEQYELLRAATILGRRDAAGRLSGSLGALTEADRARLAAYYYRPAVQAFLTEHYLLANADLIGQFMPHASAAERSYWRNFDRAPEASGLDGAVFDRLRQEAFG